MPKPNTFWESYGTGELVKVPVEYGDRGVAAQVLDKFGIDYEGSVEGGKLEDLDIKHMDALEAIRVSLLQSSAESGSIYEAVVNHESGKVEFVAIGNKSWSDNVDSYYEIQTGTYVEKCSGVLIRGKKPKDVWKPLEWKPIWGDGEKVIVDTNFLVSKCVTESQGYSRHATILFNDPHLNSEFEDGITNLFELTKDNPWDQILGYAYRVDPHDDDPLLSVDFSATATILVPIDETNRKNTGELKFRPAIGDTPIDINPECFKEETADEVSSEGAVKLELNRKWRYENVRGTEVDKFKAVKNVYVVGRRIKSIDYRAKDDGACMNDPPAPGDTEIWLYIDNAFEEVWKLERGAHYSVVYEELNGFYEPYIAFINNSIAKEEKLFDGEKTVFIDPLCAYFLRHHVYTLDNAVILPTDLNDGILVKEIFVEVELDSPSIVVSHPNGKGNRAMEVAQQLDFDVAAVMVVREPEPLAFNGKEVNQVDSIVDHDPTTVQSFEDTEQELIADRMAEGGNGIVATFSFLDKEGVEKLSGALYDYMNSGDGTEAVYICGPGTEVDLGDLAPNGGIVNSISYSYQDSSSYTISVNSGGRLVGGFGGFSGGLNHKAVENVSSNGRVIQDMGNGIFFKVRLDQVGDMVAINMCDKVIRVGDTVSCTIHNNPVEQ